MFEQLKSTRERDTFNANFFHALEQKDIDELLLEIIMSDINKMFESQITKYRGVSSEFNAMLKRKNLLEARLFKKRYEKIQRYLNGSPNIAPF